MDALDLDRNNEDCLLADLARESQHGNQEAFSELVRRTCMGIGATVRNRVRDPGRAEDVIQLTYFRAWTKIGKLREPGAVAKWLHCIALRCAASHLRRAATSLPMIPESSELLNNIAAGNILPPDCEAEREELRQLVRDVIAGLRPQDREILTEIHFFGLSMEEVAAKLEIPIGTVKSRLHKARRRFQDAMAAEYGISC